MGMFFPWAIGEGLIVWRWAKAKAPPPPGVLLLASGLFIGLAIMAEYRPARGVAITFAYAVDLAVLLRVIGKDPTVFPGAQTGDHMVTGWPPDLITDPSVILPSHRGAAASGSTSASTSGTRGAPGTSVA